VRWAGIAGVTAGAGSGSARSGAATSFAVLAQPDVSSWPSTGSKSAGGVGAGGGAAPAKAEAEASSAVAAGGSTGFARGFRVTFVTFVTFAVVARPFAAGLATLAAGLAAFAALAFATFFVGFVGLAGFATAFGGGFAGVFTLGFAPAVRGFGLEADRDDMDFLDVLTV
jgi:hypothetical protein